MPQKDEGYRTSEATAQLLQLTETRAATLLKMKPDGKICPDSYSTYLVSTFSPDVSFLTEESINSLYSKQHAEFATATVNLQFLKKYSYSIT